MAACCAAGPSASLVPAFFFSADSSDECSPSSRTDNSTTVGECVAGILSFFSAAAPWVAFV